MSPCFATAIPTVVVILPLSLAEAFSGFGCLCDSQYQAATKTRTRNTNPPIQRISFLPRPAFGGCSVISNTTSISLPSRARGQITSSPLVLFFFRVSAEQTFGMAPGFQFVFFFWFGQRPVYIPDLGTKYSPCESKLCWCYARSPSY
jgi:hypothetical protein